MFKVAKKRTVEWPVAVNVPQDGGKTMKASFDATFEVLTQDEQEEAVRQGRDLLDVQLAGWGSGVQDEDGNPMPFSPETKTRLLDITYVRAALFQAIAEIQNGRAAARKN